MSQGDVPIDPDATRIRTAAGHCFRHRSDEVLVRPEIAIVANPASYSAHRVIVRVQFRCQIQLARGSGVVNRRRASNDAWAPRSVAEGVLESAAKQADIRKQAVMSVLSDGQASVRPRQVAAINRSTACQRALH